MKKENESNSVRKCTKCGDTFDCSDSLVKLGFGDLCMSCIELESRKRELELKNKFYFGLEAESVSNDLRDATVNSYNSENASQQAAKEAAIRLVKTFDENKRQSLVLSGTSGIGKSHLAYSIVKAIRSKGYKALFIKSTNLLSLIRKSYSKPTLDEHIGKLLDEETILKILKELDLLVIDDLGSEYVKRNDVGNETWATDILFRVFDSRLDKSTICTTNYSETDMKTKYGSNGPRIVDRMMDRAVLLRIEGDSYRRKRAAF